MRSLVLIALVLLGVCGAGCSKKPAGPTETAGRDPSSAESDASPTVPAAQGTGTGAGLIEGVLWSAERDGLRIGLELPPSVRLSELATVGPEAIPTLTAKLHFRNERTEPLRVLLIRPEAFRLFNSTFRFWPQGEGDPLGLQPDPHPHGYLLSEEDFYLLDPGASRTFEQTLYLKDELREPGTYRVEWRYENGQQRFPGGIQTMDGVTEPLFGGGDVADLWVSTLTVEATLTVEP